MSIETCPNTGCGKKAYGAVVTSKRDHLNDENK